MSQSVRLNLPPVARDSVRALAASKVREVANAGFGHEDVLRFWFGEGDQPTPDYIRAAAIAALREGRTFYTHNQGTADLRSALGGYLRGLHGQAFADDRLSITSSGVSALMIAMQSILEPGDRVVAVGPVWPNIVEIPGILSAKVHRIGLRVVDGLWSLDLDELLAAITPDTRLVLLNSPNNPTGWMLTREQQRAILEHCRRLGVWILSDDVYERLAFDIDPAASRSATSFLTLIEDQDRLISTNSFSKAWRMTGWRLGWIVAPSALHADLGKLLEYNTSCAPDFVQAGAVAALEHGEADAVALLADLRSARDRLIAGLATMDGLTTSRPQGGMYVMLGVEGEDDSVDLAKRLIREAGLGLAPGAGFGPEGEGWLRWCIATSGARLDAGLERLAGWLKTRR